jgi:hypothetical protein
MYVQSPAAYPKIASAADAVAKELSPHVRRIRFDIAQDWSGDLAIFFRVLLSDEASERAHLRDITGLVEEHLDRHLNFVSLGLQAYFNFRSQSEQARMLEPAWA